MRRPGIHYRLMAAAVLLISAATFTLDIVGVEITRRFMHKRFKDRIAFLARYLALNSEVGVLIGDRAGLKSLALNLLGEEDVARVRIADAQGELLVDISRTIPGPLSVVETPVVFKQARDESLLFTPEINTPFGKQLRSFDEAIGQVQIDYSTYTIRQLMTRITRQFIWVSLGLVLMSGIVYFFLSRAIVTDVRQLVTTARRVAGGDMDSRASAGRLPETAELAAAFNGMLDSLHRSQAALALANQEMYRQKTLAELGKFSMMIAHEVKNPLGIIKSSLDVLKKDVGLSGDNLMVEYMEDEIQRLNRLIEEFLVFARPARPNFREVDLNAMLVDVCDRFRLLAVSGGSGIGEEVPREPFMATADRDLLSRVMANVIKNAREASGDGGRVLVAARVEADRWRAVVTDTGPGVPVEARERIFEPFFTTRARGTGLGLAFAAQIVTAHGGVLSVGDAEEGGAVFTVEIPSTPPGIHTDFISPETFLSDRTA